jgi:ribonuclease HII
MKRTVADGSGNQSPRNDRVRSLLSFDRSFLCPSKQGPAQSNLGQMTLTFSPSQDNYANQPPYPRLVGFDEAGRGSLAGPVTVACVHFDWADVCSPTGDFRDDVLEAYVDLNDSKQVTKRNRSYLYKRILAGAQCGIGFASAVEIDRLGIVSACCVAARRAYQRLNYRPGSLSFSLGSDCGPGRNLGCDPDIGSNPALEVRADIGLFDRGLSLGETEETAAFSSSIQITKGDAKSFHIAAASILAKVRRDALMCSLSARAEAYGLAEVYGFASNKGYGSAAHISAIRQHGPSRFHRQTFLSKVNKSNY